MADRVRHTHPIRHFGTCLFITLGVLTVLLFFLAGRGYVKLVHPGEDRYPVRGVDVSAADGVLDWQRLADQGTDFACIRATEGSGMQDARWGYNSYQARRSGIRVAAVHVFSPFDDGMRQADNFIRTVSQVRGMLPPVIELGEDALEDTVDGETLRHELDALLLQVEQVFGQKPMLSVSPMVYLRRMAGLYEEYPLYLRWVYTPPVYPFASWTLWQYDEGAQGSLRRCVFYGDERQFADFGW